MRTFALSALLLTACTGPAPDTGGRDTGGTDTAAPIEPGTETVSTAWDVDLWSEYESPTIPRFDTLGGRRKLDGMTITVDHSAEMTVSVENGSDVPLVADDYTAELNFMTIIQLGAVEDPDDSPPFFGPGSFVADVAVDLASNDGDSSGGADQHEETVTDTIQFEADYDWVETPTYLEAMIGTEPLQLVVGGFSEMWVYWADDVEEGLLLYAEATAIQYAGTMTVTYAYSAAE